MLQCHFDPKQPYSAVVYLRMSSDQQNERSPDQQLNEIRRRLTAMCLPWRIVKEYRDEGISGRYVRRRLGFRSMLQDLHTGAISVDLVLVDTFERFGRADEVTAIRKELHEKSGVLVLTADSNFADPNTPQGRALGMVEAMRSTEDGRIKAHNVLRGKRDAATQKHWPGGPTPFGFKLQSVMKDVKGCMQVDHRILVPDPDTAWIIVLLHEKAAETGWGSIRLARFLTDHPDVPSAYKPFLPANVGRWLGDPIYCGELLFCKTSTGIIDDARVVKKNADADMLRVPDFCAAIVPLELKNAVMSLLQARRQRLESIRQRPKDGSGKLIAAPAPGMALKYLLTGLVRCGLCGRSMVPSSGGVYEAKDGALKRYAYYVCPGHIAGVCPNDKRIQEPWLRQVVVARVLERLFPTGI